MGNRRLPMGILRAPLGHWIIAVILAAGVAWGTHAWLAYKALRSAQTATLSWDAAVARRMDPSLAEAAEPAVATAQSILSDPVVATLARSASPSSANSAHIGEFRSRLELRQSSASVLQVGYRDPSPKQAAQTANAVARTLVAGMAALPGAPPASANPPAAPVPAAVPSPETQPPAVVKTPASASGDESDSLAHSLSRLEAELSATRNKLDSLNTDAWERREYPELSSYRESKEQQLLTAQVGAALKEVADMRAAAASGAAAQEPFAEIQEALRSVWPASRADRTMRSAPAFARFNAAGVDASRLREERAEFARAIAVVQKEQDAIQRLQPVQSAPVQTQAAETPPAAPPASASPDAAASPIAESEIPKPSAEEPFQLLRPAGTPVRDPLWPAILAGFCCGLLYLVAAGSHYHQEEEEEEYPEENGQDSQRMITPSKPLRPSGFFDSSEPGSKDNPDNAEPRSTKSFESAQPRSADFFERDDSRPAEIILPRPQIESPDPPGSLPDERSSDVRVQEITQEITMDADETKRPFQEEIVSEERGTDPWVDNIIKTLSETSIGRMYEKPVSGDLESDREDVHSPSLSIHPDRLAG